MLVSLRRGALLLATAIARLPSWALSQHQVAELLVQALLSSFPEIRGAASQALVTLRDNGLLDRDVLQSIVRPALDSLRDASALTVPALTSLHTLLDLLPDAFNEKLAERVTEHLCFWLKRVQVSRFVFGFVSADV
jgi:hypothetical protein